MFAICSGFVPAPLPITLALNPAKSVDGGAASCKKSVTMRDGLGPMCWVSQLGAVVGKRLTVAKVCPLDRP